MPIAKKSASAASASAASAAPGTSIITPSGGSGLGNGDAAAAQAPRHLLHAPRGRGGSRRRVEIIGSRMRTGPSSAARSIAASWASSRRRSLQRQADRAQAERRVGRVGAAACLASGLGQFVAADIERAERHRPPVHAAHQAGIELVLLVLVGQVLAVHVEELGAHQPEPRGAVGHRLLELDRQFEIGFEADLDAVAGHRRQPAQPRELPALARAASSRRSR